MAAYRIMLWGYGGDGAYIKLNQEQYDFWKAKYDESGEDIHCEDPLMDYMLAEGDFEELGFEVPEYADFMAFVTEDGEKFYPSWMEAPTEFCHQWGVSYDTNVNVSQVDEAKYNAKDIGDPLTEQRLSELQENWDEIVEFGIAEDYHGNMICEPEYVVQFWSAEKGTFFEGYFETDEPYDEGKLKFFAQEYPNGDDTIVRVEYDGHEILNEGGDTYGKGYSVSIWSNI